MTGEVSLTGRVLPIGGVKQKLLAAHRAGITTVLIPARNEPDLDDVPASVLAELTVKLVADATEVIEAALEPVRRCGPARRLTRSRFTRAGQCRRARERKTFTGPGISVALSRVNPGAEGYP